MYFSPAYLTSLIVEPLRYYFSNFSDAELRWTDDPKTTGIEIGSINDYHKLAIQQKPRILVSRGQYSINPTGLSDNLAEGKGFLETKGNKDEVRMLILNGVSQVMVEARNEGTAEKILDHTQHFLAWTSSMIASTQGFKNFCLPMNVSPCTPSKEDTEIFQSTINIPWSKEEQWRITDDNTQLKAFLLSMVKA